MFKIYALEDPRPNAIKKYIGHTEQTLKARLANHWHEARASGINSRKVQWLRELRELGIKPSIVLLAEFAGNRDGARRLEWAWIAYYEALGYDLVNSQGVISDKLWAKTWIQAEDQSPEECLVKLDAMAQYRFKLLAEKLEVDRATIIASTLSEFLDKQMPTAKAMNEFYSKPVLSLKKRPRGVYNEDSDQ